MIEIKKSILKEFENLVNSKEKLSELATGIKEIREKWNKSATVSSKIDHNFQKEFSKLNESFNGVYELEFNRVHLSLIRRGIIFDGIVMQPIHLEKAGSEQVLFELTLDELSFTGLWYGLQNQKLYVREVRLDRPNFRVVASPSHSVSQQDKAPQRKVRSPVALLENELRKSIKNLPLAGIHVGRVLVNQAQVFFLNFLSQQELLAKEASFTALDLNWTPIQPWETPFNARGFEFELEGVTYALPDGVHQISSKKVFISSLEETIEL